MSTSKPVDRRISLSFIFAVLLLDVMGLTLLFPVQAFVVRQYSADALMVALVPVLYAAAQFVSTPALGRLSDRFGRRPLLLLCLLGSAVGYFLFGLGGSLAVLFASRVLDGITGGNVSIASAYIADVSEPHERPKNFALVGMAFGLGFILGPALGGALSVISLAAPAYAAGALALLAAAVGWFVLPESLPLQKRDNRPLRAADLNPLASISQYVRRPVIGRLLLVNALFAFVFDGNNGIASLWLLDRFAITPGALAILLVLGGLATALVQGALVDRAVKRFGEKQLAMLSLVSLAVGTAAWVLVPSLAWLYPLNPLTQGVTSFIWPTMGTLLANHVGDHEQGQLSGVSTAISGLMSVLGPLWAGAAYDVWGPTVSFAVGVPLTLIALLALNGLTTVVRPGRRQVPSA